MFTDFDYLKRQIPYLWGVDEGTPVEIEVKNQYFLPIDKTIVIFSNLDGVTRSSIERLILEIMVEKSGGTIKYKDVEFENVFLNDPENDIRILFK